jgi:molybdopterin converting factor small subunit
VLVQVRVRLGTGLARIAVAPVLTVELPDGATVADLFGTVAAAHPDLAVPLRSALPVVEGARAEPARQLTHGEEVALLTPVAGG